MIPLVVTVTGATPNQDQPRFSKMFSGFKSPQNCIYLIRPCLSAPAFWYVVSARNHVVHVFFSDFGTALNGSFKKLHGAQTGEQFVVKTLVKFHVEVNCHLAKGLDPQALGIKGRDEP